MDGTLQAQLLGQTLTTAELSEKRKVVYKDVLKNSPYLKQANFRSIHSSDLERLFHAYDDTFFNNRCGKLTSSNGNQLSFRLSKQMTRTGGTTSLKRKQQGNKKLSEYQITVSATLLFETFGSVKRPIQVAGIHCRNRLEALQRVFEHELIHLIEWILWDDSSCSQRRFHAIAKRNFGHTDVVHQLITPQETAWFEYGLRPGALVTFNCNGHELIGTINRITRRATVLVLDNSGQLYSDGKRYSKYYVPLKQLRQLTKRKTV